jgi:hypothetical protein
MCILRFVEIPILLGSILVFRSIPNLMSLSRGSTQVGGAVYEGLVLICNETQHVMGFTQFRKVRRA